MLRKVLRRSAAVKLAQPPPGSGKRLQRRFLIHTNACKQEDVDEDRGDASPAAATAVSKKSSVRPVAPNNDHRSLFSSSIPQTAQQQSAAGQSDLRRTAPRAPPATKFPSLKLKPLNGITHGITAKDLEACVIYCLCCVCIKVVWRSHQLC